MLTTEYMLGKILDYYSSLNLDGEISEEEMESRMDRARIMDNSQIRRLYQRINGLKRIADRRLR